MKFGSGKLPDKIAKPLLVLAAGVVVLGLVFFGVSFSRIFASADEALELTDYVRFRHTEKRLGALAEAVQWRAGFDEAPVPTDVDGLVAWLFDEAFEEMEGSEVLNLCGPGLRKSGSYHDHWDRPIKITAVGEREYLLVSFGADGDDDDGKGDDVVNRFDPLVNRLANLDGAEEN